jgi:hypothetical protein
MSMPFLGICAQVKNEGQYIYEWLAYHRAVGVERFTIYDNSSTDNTVEEIRRFPYPVDLIPWPGSAVQMAAYNDMIQKRRRYAEWVAFIDADEFLTPRGSQSIKDYLRSLPGDVGAVYVNWLCFGSSGQKEHEPGPVTERFQRRGHLGFGPNRMGKTIARMEQADVVRNVHIVRSKGRMVTMAGNEMDQTLEPGDFKFAPCHEPIALHHYFTKSWAEWEARRALGRATRPEGDKDRFRPPAQFHSHDVNDVVDDTAARIMAQARRATP